MNQQPIPSRTIKRLLQSTPYCLVLLAMLYFFSQPANTDSPQPSVRQAIEKLLASKQHPLLLQADFSQHSDALVQLYQMNANQLIWLGEDSPAKNRDAALAVLNNAAADGLNPLDYDAERLGTYMKTAVALPDAAVTELVSYDVALSVAMLHFVRDLHVGRVDPRHLDYPMQFAAKSAIDVAALLNQHLQQQSLAELPVAAAPKIKQYQQLKQLLATYRSSALPVSRPQLQFAKSLRPGDQDPQLPALRQRLLELGELSAADAAKTDALYDPLAVAAVQRIQEGQGLKADGLIGKQTLALLNQSTADKVALIELAMERLRWLPESPEGPRIFVNIPAFQLSAFSSLDDQNPLRMKVVVGKAQTNQTPILWEEMKYLEFMPYWNIPKSIMDKEIIPKLQDDDGYLDNQDIELVERYSDSDEETEESVIDNIKQGRVRARQRPGSRNPLGRVKFIFPNKAEVYLHDTPTKSAFNRDRRDLSHGCVRVAEAEKLAEFVLTDQPGWDQQTIQQAMAGPKTQRVTLKRSIPVLFYYTTAIVDQDNKPRFYPDIYGQDALLQAALKKSLGGNEDRQLVSKNANPTVGG